MHRGVGFMLKTVALGSALLASIGATSNAELETVKLSHPIGSSAEVYLFGAHVKSFRAAMDKNLDILFMSNESFLDGVNPIRGGIPVVFPNFGSAKGFPSHGFARITNWTLDGVTEAKDTKDATVAKFTMTSSDSTREMWPVDFKLEYEVSLFPNQLQTALRVQNTFTSEIEFHALLHNYLWVDDARDEGVTVKGLKGVDYYDKVAKANLTETREFISFNNQTDNVYSNAPSPLTVNIRGVNNMDRWLEISKTGYISSDSTLSKNVMEAVAEIETDAVVWNPWADRAKTMEDFGDEEYKNMVAVEPGRVSEKQKLPAGKTYTLQQSISVFSV
ncbi:hypothetical protein G195_009226 [Phytophthora kernoviae 00238/432]|uniref:glucose-6-phosphate 1-epimerase n=1 Tax=Phytophthora kernoviae 00238/432 TaxID=1284355 RepID=A0A8J4SBD2_9STRA|nr:hypothetical protein G195_009226 [Phytophthora kernoviae 00238/432]